MHIVLIATSLPFNHPEVRLKGNDTDDIGVFGKKNCSIQTFSFSRLRSLNAEVLRWPHAERLDKEEPHGKLSNQSQLNYFDFILGLFHTMEYISFASVIIACSK